jgi:hypothetical protein
MNYIKLLKKFGILMKKKGNGRRLHARIAMQKARKIAAYEITNAVELTQNDESGYTAVAQKVLNTLQKAGFRNVHRKDALKKIFTISSREERLRYVQDHVSISRKQVREIVTVSPRDPYPRPKEPNEPKVPIEPFFPKDFDLD